MKFITTLQQDEDGVWISECPAIPGCVSQGKTQQEATANLKEAMQACLAVRSAQGMPLVVETREIELQTARAQACPFYRGRKLCGFSKDTVGPRRAKRVATSFSPNLAISPPSPFQIIGKWLGELSAPSSVAQA